MDTINILSLNTRGTKNKYDQILKQISAFDIVLLQEQHIGEGQEMILKYIQDTQRLIKYSTDVSNHKTIMTLIKPHLQNYVTNQEIAIDGRLIITSLKIK